ncbi:bacterial regulatory, arsR family protein [Mycolicibacterium hassiacum DSM 44199]|uniref:Bacterial regulatory, arsR family protein n=1 Tax=Mycolicibacterium hassiacum (strain DSM 44199 / CIP 105218 / JCM 12690 / 3849) TaxID=1122247 RepID=K5B9P6_MYCHD|nr:bacterial regulatory, arsR family protein [Mycolicibacterium hassiacum DSM 44199]MDA4087769.1 MarR family transcriptional regulator [Mycolicibacterium hassiacum DSM 44199]VCT92366.1 Organic hydroperoxide resistance transcriptional regulator [Mycolicibacterium hassiacum DSM 44199]
MALTDEQQRIWRSYLAMTSRLQTAMHRQLQRDCGLSLADYDVLVALSEHGPLRVGDLAALLSWEQSRLSHQLRRMRGRGLVLRRESDEDRRSATVELTAAGHTKLAAAAPGHAALVRATVFDGIPVAQLRAFGEVAATVVGRLG